MARYEFKSTRRIEFADTDLAGIVHFANFFQYMEATEHEFYRSLGLPLHFGGDSSHGWPRVSARCDYKSPLRFGDEIEVHLVVREKRARSIRYGFVIRRLSGDGGASEAVAAFGDMTAVSVAKERASGRMSAVAIPDDYAAAIAQAPDDVWSDVWTAAGGSPD